MPVGNIPSVSMPLAAYPRETLQAFDLLLAQRGLRLDAIVAGGAALNLLGVISRETKDCDILHPTLGKSSRRQRAILRCRSGHWAGSWSTNG